MTTGSVDIDVIIVNWNGGDSVLESARSSVEFGARAIVVDNGSSDGSPERIEGSLPNVTVVRMGRNAGFAAACNRGAAEGDGEFIFLLNPDASIVAGTPAAVQRAFAQRPGTTIVGPRVEADTAACRGLPADSRRPCRSSSTSSSCTGWHDGSRPCVDTS